MRQALAAATLASFVATNAHAALAPDEQRKVELQRIIESAELALLISDAPIDSIITRSADVYIVGAGGCRVVIRIVDAPAANTTDAAGTPMVGPRNFVLNIGKPSCKAKQ